MGCLLERLLWPHKARECAWSQSFVGRFLQAPCTMAAAPPLTADQAKDALKKVLSTFIEPSNKAKLEAALAEVAALPPDQQGMAKMAKLVPLVTSMCTPIMTEYNQANVMMGVMQIQMQAQANPAIGEGCALLMKAVSGTVPSDEEVQAVIGKL